MRFLLVAVACVTLTGCEPKDRDSIAKETGKAWEHASRAAATAWNSVAKKVAEITPDSPEAAMAEARSAAESAQQQLSKIPNPTPEIMRQVEGAKAAIAKLDAAQKLRDLQDRASKMVAEAQRQAENAGKSTEMVRQNLEGANKSYQALQQQIDEARARYDQTASEVQRLVK